MGTDPDIADALSISLGLLEWLRDYEGEFCVDSRYYVALTCVEKVVEHLERAVE